MLILGVRTQTIPWVEAGIELDLVPLNEDVDARLVEETTRYIENDRGPRVKRDVAAYAQGIGRHCIKGWKGVVDPAGKPVKCTPGAIDNFMLIEPAQNFVISKVKSLEIHLHKETDKAKNASEPS